MRALLLTGAAAILSGCVSTADPALFASQGFVPVLEGVSAGADQADTMALNGDTATQTASAVPMPVPSPNSSDATSRMPAAAENEFASGQAVVMADTAVDALNRGITQSQPTQTIGNLYGAAPAPANIALPDNTEPQSALDTPQTTSANVTPTIPEAAAIEIQPQVQELAVVAPPKKKSIFARMFAPQNAAAKNAPTGTKKRLTSSKPNPVTVASAGGDALPGVKLATMFDGSNNTSGNSDAGQIQLASAAGLARLAPNGLHLQTDRVKVDCFKPQLIRTLKSIEHHYGRPVTVTSGYRSPKHNRRVGGASGSRHTSCEAADIQIDGVSKWQLAKYLRSMPGRGGVGTYCHTESVHIDVGNTRDWNWRCRRRK